MGVACLLLLLFLHPSQQDPDQFTQCSYGPFALLSNGIPNWAEASTQCHRLPSAVFTNIYSLAEITDAFLVQVVSTLSLSACQQPVSSSLWIGPASNNVFAFGAIPPTGVAPPTALLNQGLCFGRPTYTALFNPFIVTSTAVQYVQLPPVVVTVTSTATVSTRTTTAPPLATTTQLTVLTTTSRTVSDSDRTTTTTVTTLTAPPSTLTISTTDNTTTLTQMVTSTRTTTVTDSTVVVVTTNTTVTSLTDGAQTVTSRSTTTITSCPSATTTLTVTTSTTVPSATTTSTSTVRTLSSLSTATVVTGPCVTNTRTVETTCTLRQVQTVTQTQIVAPFNPCDLGQKLVVCGAKSEEGLVLVLNQVPAAQSGCMCASIGKRPADLDDIGAAAAFSLIRQCVGERQHAWIGAIEGRRPQDGCLAAQSGPIIGSSENGTLGRPQPCSVFLPILCH